MRTARWPAIELAFNGHADAESLQSRGPDGTVAPAGARAGSDPGARDGQDRHRRTCGAGIAQAALRARAAGFDLVYVYAGHDLGLPMHFLSRRHNRRSDEYGGSLENRVRFLRELIEDTKDAVGDRCGVVVRLAVDELLGDGGHHRRWRRPRRRSRCSPSCRTSGT